jgi:thymidylate kinase
VTWLGLSAADEALLRALPDDALGVHGVPDADVAARRERAAERVSAVVGGHLRVSPLGAGWSSDLDVHVPALPEDVVLEGAGWRSLDRLLQRLGSSGRGRWAVVEHGQFIAGLDLTTAPVPDGVDGVAARTRRRGEVRVREVLELRVLQRTGATVARAGDDVLAAAAALERALGGTDLSPFGDGRRATASRPVPVGSSIATRTRRFAGAARRARAPRVVVGLSGVDGSGKSSLAGEVVRQLHAAGVPASVVWARPGMRLGALSSLARVGRRLLGQGSEPGVRTVATGASVDLPSRRGVVGLGWAVLVAIAFGIDVRRRHARARGVVVYDRHLLDALVTLDFVYAGADLRLARWLCTRAVPRADAAFYVAVDAEVAVARKPGDTFGHHAVSSQLDGYRRWLASMSGIEVLDGTRPTTELAAVVLDRVLTGSRR